jgi:hypothetical protein
MVVDTELARHVLPKNFLRPCLLLLLHESPAHGYDLRERLRPLGFGRDDPGRLYRALRTLEAGGSCDRPGSRRPAGPIGAPTSSRGPARSDCAKRRPS